LKRPYCGADILVETDRGVSDEGHPWFVFCRSDTGEVVLHLARFDGVYVVAGPAIEGCARGPNFRTLIERATESYQPLLALKRHSVIYTHLSTLILVMLTFCFGKIPTKKTSESSVGRSLPPLNPNYTSEKATTSQEGHCNEFDRQVDIVGAAGIVLIQHDIISRTIVSSSSVVNTGKLTSELTSTDMLPQFNSLELQLLQSKHLEHSNEHSIVELPTHCGAAYPFSISRSPSGFSTIDGGVF
jgi:hypothetical protein